MQPRKMLMQRPRQDSLLQGYPAPEVASLAVWLSRSTSSGISGAVGQASCLISGPQRFRLLVRHGTERMGAHQLEWHLIQCRSASAYKPLRAWPKPVAEASHRPFYSRTCGPDSLCKGTG